MIYLGKFNMRNCDDEKIASILGFRDVKIDNVDDFLTRVRTCIYPVKIQVVNAIRVAGKPHLFFAYINAKKSFEQGQGISDSLELETLLYSSCQRQINKAIDMIGVTPQTSNLAVILFDSGQKEIKDAENMLIKLVLGVRDDSVLKVKERNKCEELMNTFRVTELEMETMTLIGLNRNEALIWLIVERVSLLSVKRY
jgi:tRNA threonylcarbamoyladenosine modification (KEOPS) complex Cgi121 subunit